MFRVLYNYFYKNNSLNKQNDTSKENDVQKEINIQEKITNIVFEGGGVKGVAYIGVIKHLDELGILKNIKAFAGSSAGAITASLLAIGCDYNDIVDNLYDINFKNFLDNDKNLFLDAVHLIKDYGACSGEYFINWLGNIIYKKTNNKDYTLGDLWNDKKINLVITTTELNSMDPIYLSYKTHPDLSIRYAVRLSMSIPYIFEAVRYNDNIYVDGGLMDNYPLHVFDGEYPGDPYAISDDIEPNIQTLGVRMIGNNDDVQGKSSKTNIDINNLKSFTMTIFNSMMKSASRQYSSKRYWERSIVINTGDISGIDFSLSDNEKRILQNNGYLSCKEFFNKLK